MSLPFQTLEQIPQGVVLEEKFWLNLAARDSTLSGKKDQLEVGGGQLTSRPSIE